MAYHTTEIGRFRVKEQSGWGTAATPSASDDLEIIVGFLPQTPQETIQPDVLKAGHYEASLQAGVKGGDMPPFSMPLHGWSSATPSGDPTEHPDALLLRLAMGAASQDGYHASDLTTGGDTTTVPLSGNGTDDESGHAILVPLAAGGYGIGWITDHTTNTYTVTTLPSSPATSGAIYGSNTIYMTNDSPTNGLTSQWLGADGNSAIVNFDGGVMSATLDLSAGAQPTLEIGWGAHDWTNSGTGGSPSAAAYTYPQLPVATGSHGSRLVINGTAVKAGATTLTITTEIEAVPDHASAQGKYGWTVARRSMRLDITTASSDLSSLPSPGDAKNVLQLDVCTTPGRAFSVLMPEAVVIDRAEVTAAGRLVGYRTTYGCDIYTGDTETAAPADTYARIAFL